MLWLDLPSSAASLYRDFSSVKASAPLSLSLSVSNSESMGLLLGFFFLDADTSSSSSPLVLSWARFGSLKQVGNACKIFYFFLFPSHNFCIGVFHLMSPQPCWCHKTNKQQPCWCPKLTLPELTCIFMQMCFCFSLKNTAPDHVRENEGYLPPP